MNRGSALLTLAVTSLFLGSVSEAVANAAHTRHHGRTHHIALSALDEPALRSTAALVVDETHASVLFSRRADVALPTRPEAILAVRQQLAEAR